jgi:hypothetical protein
MNATILNWDEHSAQSGLAVELPIDQADARPIATPHLWVPVIGFTLVAGCLFFLAGFRIDDPSVGGKLLLGLTCAAMGYAGLRFGARVRVAWAVVGLTQAAAISVGGMMLTYAAASLDMPLVDDKLLWFDQAIGYRWMDYAAFVHAHPWLGQLLLASYLLIFAMPTIALFALAGTGRTRQINRYLIAMMISLVATASIFALSPALTAWDYLGIDPHMVQRFNLPNATSGWEHDLLEIRAGRGFILHHADGSGLTAFPSYHCVAGLLFVWALWPIGRIRIPAIVASALLIAATPIFGGHYIADLFGGLFVAALSIVAAQWLERVWHRYHETPLPPIAPA